MLNACELNGVTSIVTDRCKNHREPYSIVRTWRRLGDYTSANHVSFTAPRVWEKLEKYLRVVLLAIELLVKKNIAV